MSHPLWNPPGSYVWSGPTDLRDEFVAVEQVGDSFEVHFWDGTEHVETVDCETEADFLQLLASRFDEGWIPGGRRCPACGAGLRALYMRTGLGTYECKGVHPWVLTDEVNGRVIVVGPESVTYQFCVDELRAAGRWPA